MFRQISVFQVRQYLRRLEMELEYIWMTIKCEILGGIFVKIMAGTID